MAKRWWLPLVALTPLPAMANDQDPQDLSTLSIEELAQIPVSGASKREEPLSSVPNAAFVITNDDITRSAATSIPELLRQAPGLDVQRVNATQYAISARGFGGYEASNKLLVLVDGRSVYSTLHSGVFWDLRSPLLEDIQQIEVISGPGGTLFGPNAVNGVINIRSKSAFDAQGVMLRGTAGTNDKTAGARYGFKLGENAAVRVYGNWYDRADMAPSPIGPGNIDDAIRGWQAGFRADIRGEGSLFTVQGDVFDAERFQVAGDGNRGHNLLGRWTSDLNDNSSLQFQAYYDYFERRELGTVDVLETVDAEVQYNLSSGAHNLVAGAGVRTTRDQFVNTLNAFNLDPQRQRLWIGNAFVQDRFALTPTLSVTAGVKLEGSSYTGVQFLPNLRLAWKPSERALIWGAVSRAVRTPSRIDRDLMATGILASAPDFASEKLTAFELGYRGQPATSTSLSLSLFYNRYRDLRSARFTGPVPVFLPIQLANDLRGKTYGVEATVTQQILPWWRVTAGATWLEKDFEVRRGQIDVTAGASLGQDPKYQFSLRSQVTLPGNLRFDVGLRAVDGLDRPQIDGYVEADARLSYGISDAVELFVAGENLLHDRHLESNDANRTQWIERSVHAGTRLRF
ncbi:MAG: TonB-dependent receptor [Sphingomonadales bacterium]|nr:MAG: TonB-dependent receptor [Sphingomonadales bacterium]